MVWEESWVEMLVWWVSCKYKLYCYYYYCYCCSWNLVYGRFLTVDALPKSIMDSCFFSYFLSDVRLLFFSLTHKRCFNNFFVMLVCLLLFRRYRLCLFCFFLESVAGGEKEVYLSNLVVAVKWHLSLCVCIPLKVYICVIPKKRRVGIWILLLFFYILWTTTKNLAQSFKGFFIFLFFKYSIYKSKIFNNTFFVFIFLLYISKILGILLEISHNIFAYFKICKSLFYLYFFFW